MAYLPVKETDIEEVVKGAQIHSYLIDNVSFLATLANAT